MADTPWSHIRAIRSEPGRWEDYSREREPACDVVQAARYTVSPATITKDADTIIVADQVRVEGAIVIPGLNITIIARQIMCAAGASIDCSGPAGSPIGHRATDGRTVGAKGDDGAEGEAGKNGGSIVLGAYEIVGPLTVRSNGGPGAKGQKGGNGARGDTGFSGADASEGHPSSDNGFPGYEGGQAGSGGTGGRGGDSGKILVRWVKGAAPAVECLPGHGGDPGEPGDPGPGGFGGPPGDPCFDTMGTDRDGNQFSTHVCVNRGGNGPDGPAGPRATQDHPPGQPGHLVPADLKATTTSEIAEYIPITQAYMTLADSELNFINQQREGVRDQLAFLKDVAGTPKAGEVFEQQRAARLGSAAPGPTPEEWKSLAARAATLLARFDFGLDAFGYPPHYVSQLNRDLLDNEAVVRIGIAKSIEATYNSYEDHNAGLHDQVVALKQALDSTNASIQLKTKEANDADKNADAAQTVIATLSGTAQDLARQLMGADQDFRNAVEHRSSNCQFKQIMEFVGGVIAVAAGVAAGYAGIADALATMNNDFPEDKDFIEQVKFVRDTFNSADIPKNYQAMQNGYNEIKDSLQNKNVKLVISLESFEAQLQQYMTLSEAVKYRDLMRSFVGASQARNTAQLDYTRWILAALEARSQIEGLKLEANRIQSTLVLFSNPSLSQCISYLERYLKDAKRRIIEILDLEHKALTYVTLTQGQPHYTWGSVAELEHARLDLHAQWINSLQTRGGEEVGFQAEYVLEKARNPDVFAKLQRSQPASFTIPTNHSEFNRGKTSFVTVTEVTLSAPGITSRTGSFTCNLTHTGNPIVVDQRGARFNFVHTVRPTILSYKRSGAGWAPISDIAQNLRGSPDKFIYLSPFAGWIISFDALDKVDLSSVPKIILTFKAKTIPANSLAMRNLVEAQKAYLQTI